MMGPNPTELFKLEHDFNQLRILVLKTHFKYKEFSENLGFEKLCEELRRLADACEDQRIAIEACEDSKKMNK